MKTKILIASFAFVFFSCKDTKDKTPSDKELTTPVTNTEVEEVTNPNFNVEITAYASKKDDFALYFTEDNTVNFVPENAIWSGIKGKTADAKVYFEIKEERLPTHIRLDFGLNKEQDSVVIQNIKLNYLKESFEIKGADFFQYFNEVPEFKTNINATNGTLTLYKNGTEYKTPFFYPKDTLVKKLEEITIMQ